ncbi:hypothetical protein GBAR_LOCUS7143 [Geodia barretti]|uniref:Calx-beta domain-containing protein n=1 Tax=Geodia barretti TaxID=519541 RepID=A0AA35WBC9_GEOBA|nr:hypothetical protein GBAR_LOCUS7143 [Geodia barretti]
MWFEAVLFLGILAYGSTQECYTRPLCEGDSFIANSARECCSDTDEGVSFSEDGTSCTIPQCIEPFVVAFVETTYTVTECDGQVEVCVNLTRPQTDILDEVIHLDVSTSDISSYIPSGSVLANPDVPSFLGTYPMAPGTDYEKQTQGLRGSSITESSRVVCYNQTVYCDTRLELTEYFGLSIAVRASSTVRTEVDPIYGQTAIKIKDGSSTAEVCLENTVYRNVDEIMEVCAVIMHPEESCRVQFPFSVSLSTSDDSYSRIYFTECETRSCVNVSRASFPVSLERTSDLDPRITLCAKTARVEPFVVAFVETTYTVTECDGQVEVCVNLTRPQTDILDEVIHLDVSTSDISSYIPSGSVLANPDVPSFLGTYPMAPGTDYEKQTRSANGLRGSSITESSRVVCYNQTVYCDTRLELTEYFGLSIAVGTSSTVRTEVDPIYGQTAIKMMDGSGTAEVCLENTVYRNVDEIMEVCAVIMHPGESCPIQFPFRVSLSTSDDSYSRIYFTECENRSCIKVSRASFPVSLERTSDLDARITLCAKTARVFSVTMEFESAVYTSSEDAGSVTVCAVIRGESAGEEINIKLFTEEQTARASRDFTHLEFNSVISERMCMSISIIDNYLPGSDVHFSVRATSSSHRIPPATTTVIIMDDEIPNGCTYESCQCKSL